MEDVIKTARTTNLHRLKLNKGAANERGQHKEEIAPIESENKQVEQKWVIWNEGKMDGKERRLMWLEFLVDEHAT